MQLATVLLLCGILNFSDCFEFGYYPGQRYPVIVAGRDTSIHSANGQYSLYYGSPMQYRWYSTLPMSWSPYPISHYNPVLNFQWKPLGPTYPLQYSSIHNSPLLIKLGYSPINEQKTSPVSLKDLFSVIATLHSKHEPSQKVTSSFYEETGTKELQKTHLTQTPENSALPTDISSQDTSMKHLDNNSSLVDNESTKIQEHSKEKISEETNIINETKSENSADKSTVGSTSVITNEKFTDPDHSNPSSEPSGITTEIVSQNWNKILPNPLENASITKVYVGEKNEGGSEDLDKNSFTDLPENTTDSNIYSDEFIDSNNISVNTENILETTATGDNEQNLDNVQQSTTDLNISGDSGSSSTDNDISVNEILSTTPIYNEENVLESSTVVSVGENGTITSTDYDESSSSSEYYDSLLESSTFQTEVIWENSTDISVINYEIQTPSNLYEVATENLEGSVDVVSDPVNNINSYNKDSSIDYSIDYEYQTESTNVNNQDLFTSDNYGGVDYSNNYVQYNVYETTPVPSPNENEFTYPDKYEGKPDLSIDNYYIPNRPVKVQEHAVGISHHIPTSNSASSYTEQDETNSYPEFNEYISESNYALNSNKSEGDKTDNSIYDKSEIVENLHLPEYTESGLFEMEETTEPSVYLDNSEYFSNSDLFTHSSVYNHNGFLVPEEDLENAPTSQYFPEVNENIQNYDAPEMNYDPSHFGESHNYYSNVFSINDLKNHNYEDSTNTEKEQYTEKDAETSESVAGNPIHSVESLKLIDKVKYDPNEELSIENSNEPSNIDLHEVNDGKSKFSVDPTHDSSSAYFPMATEHYQPEDAAFSGDEQSILNSQSHFPTGIQYMNTLQTNPQNEGNGEILDESIMANLLKDTKNEERNPIYNLGATLEKDINENKYGTDENVNESNISLDSNQKIPLEDFNYEVAVDDLPEKLTVAGPEDQLTDEGTAEDLPVLGLEDTSFTDHLEGGLTSDLEDEFGSHDLKGGFTSDDLDDDLSVGYPKDELVIENLKDSLGAGDLSDAIAAEDMEDDLAVGDLDDFSDSDFEDESALEDLEDDLAFGDLDYGLFARDMQRKESGYNRADKNKLLTATQVSVNNNRRSDIEIKEDNTRPVTERKKRSPFDSPVNSNNLHKLPSLQKNEMESNLEIDNNLNVNSEQSTRVKRTFDLLFGGGSSGLLGGLNPGNLLTNTIVKPILRKKYSYLRKKQLLLRLLVQMMDMDSIGSSPF